MPSEVCGCPQCAVNQIHVGSFFRRYAAALPHTCLEASCILTIEDGCFFDGSCHDSCFFTPRSYAVFWVLPNFGPEKVCSKRYHCFTFPYIWSATKSISLFSLLRSPLGRNLWSRERFWADVFITNVNLGGALFKMFKISAKILKILRKNCAVYDLFTNFAVEKPPSYYAIGGFFVRARVHYFPFLLSRPALHKNC